MSRAYSEQDRYDLKEIFRIYDFSKVEKVGNVVEEAEQNGTAPSDLFDNLYALYKIKKLPQREAVAKRLHMAVTTASDADVESVLRQTEMKGFSERDAVRTLERKYSIQHVSNRTLQAARTNLNGVSTSTNGETSELQRTTSQLRHVTVNDSSSSTLMGRSTGDEVKNDEDDDASVVFARPPSHLSAAPTRENLDDIMAEEVREWLAKMLGETYSADVLAMPNFIDALRNGVLLHVLLQKMRDPPVPDAQLKLPKRATGFFIRDNVATFLADAKSRFSLVDAQLFTDSDLVDGKSDRQVVTCLMAMARIAYSAGTIKCAPNIIMYEHEIEQQGSRLTKNDLDRIVHEAEAKEGKEEAGAAIPLLRRDGEEHVERTEERAPSVAAAPQAAAAAPVAKEEEEETEEDNAATTAHATPEKRTDDASPTKATSPLPTAENSTTDGISSSAPALVDNTSTPVTQSPSRVQSATPARQESSNNRDAAAAAAAAAESATPVAVATAAVTESRNTAEQSRESSKPQSEDLHTPQERGICPTDATNTASATEAEEEEQHGGSHGDNNADDEESSGGGGEGRVFYLRDGHLRPTKPTTEEELELLEQRKKAAPRVVWKSPSSPLAATKPPRYHSRHWDGIDIALSRHLNEHYEEHPQSPWRFHMVASTSGEYVLYNRQNAQKRVVYLRIIQTRLFVRNSGKNQPWVRIDEALEVLENS